MRHMDFTNAPKVWRTVGGGMRVRVVCPKWLKRQAEVRAATTVPLSLPHVPRLRSAVIIARVCRAYGVTPDDIRGTSMKRCHTAPRKACCYWLRRLTGMSYPKIGRIIGGKDHAAVLNAVRTYPARRAEAGRFLKMLAPVAGRESIRH